MAEWDTIVATNVENVTDIIFHPSVLPRALIAILDAEENITINGAKNLPRQHLIAIKAVGNIIITDGMKNHLRLRNHIVTPDVGNIIVTISGVVHHLPLLNLRQPISLEDGPVEEKELAIGFRFLAQMDTLKMVFQRDGRSGK